MNDAVLSLDRRPAPLKPAQRALSLAEFVVGAAIVIAHNVFHAVPNEVPILFVLAIISIRLREGRFAAIGLARPNSWPRTILFGVITAVVVIAVGNFVTDPLAARLGLHANPGAVEHALGGPKSDPLTIAKTFLLIWTFAAFGEEIGYRRYLLGRAADLGDNSSVARWLALVAASVLFGFGHYYQGPAGVFTTGCDGFMIGAAYLLARRNLWVAVIAHGMIDTIGLGLLLFGIAD